MSDSAVPATPLPTEPADLAESFQIARAKAGDRDAFTSLVRTHQDAIFSLVFRMVNRREDAEDLCQETFIRAFHALGGFEGNSSFRTWIHRIAVNLCLSRRRDLKRRPAPSALPGAGDPEGDGASSLPADSRAESPDEGVLREERRRQVQSAIAALDPESRAVIVLRDLEERSYEEIAESLGLAPGTVRSRLHRARMELKDRLKGVVGESSGDRELRARTGV